MKSEMMGGQDHQRKERDAERAMPSRALAAEQQEPRAEHKRGDDVLIGTEGAS
jgi:hypothetical protein